MWSIAIEEETAEGEDTVLYGPGSLEIALGIVNAASFSFRAERAERRPFSVILPCGLDLELISTEPTHYVPTWIHVLYLGDDISWTLDDEDADRLYAWSTRWVKEEEPAP